MLLTCQPGDSEFLCRLRSILDVLDTAAWILGILLVFAVLAAVYAYRRKPGKLTREDITRDVR